MIISKKAFDNAIKEAQNKIIIEQERRCEERDRERYLDDRFRDLNSRMSFAFADIDRRLNELEKSNAPKGDSSFPSVSRY